MNPVLMLMYNTTPIQLELTQKAYASVLAQDIGPLFLWIVNNGSDQSTTDWLRSLSVQAPHRLHIEHYPTNEAPTKIVNRTAATLFASGYDKILGVPNDAILPPNLYSELAKWPRGFVAAWMNEDFNNVASCVQAIAVHEDPHTSVMLTRKWAHDALVAHSGRFLDEGMFMYANDCDMKLRMAACGIHGIQLDIQCYHFSGGSHRLAEPEISKSITDRADMDRAYFYQKFGFHVGSQEHVNALRDLNFRG